MASTESRARSPDAGGAVWDMAAMLHRDPAHRAWARDGRAESGTGAADRLIERQALALGPGRRPGVGIGALACGRDLAVDPPPVSAEHCVARVPPDPRGSRPEGRRLTGLVGRGNDPGGAVDRLGNDRS